MGFTISFDIHFVFYVQDFSFFEYSMFVMIVFGFRDLLMGVYVFIDVVYTCVYMCICVCL